MTFRLTSALCALVIIMIPVTTVRAEPSEDVFATMRPGLMNDDENTDRCADRNGKLDRLLNSRLGQRAFGPDADIKDIAYGDLPHQKLDVFLPIKSIAKTTDATKRLPAPIIIMVHGGGWCIGDKALKSVTLNKSVRWTARDFIFISVNYPMIMDGHRADAQAASIARAVAYVQNHAADFNGDPARIILMGHSAGAHLVSLVNADAVLRATHDVKPVLGTISLDSGTLDVPLQMSTGTARLKTMYEEAFGIDSRTWEAASPTLIVDNTASAWLGICSTKRKDDPCGQAQAYADHSNAVGVRAEILPMDMTHKEINADLGLPTFYTDAVERFMGSLDPVVARLLNY